MNDGTHITIACIIIACIAAAAVVPARADMAATVALVAACQYLLMLSQ